MGKKNGALSKPQHLRDEEAAREEIGEQLEKNGYVQDANGVWSKPEADTNVSFDVTIPGFDAKHLAGQLGDFILDEMKQARHVKPWDKLSEHEQRALIDRAYTRARGVVLQAAHTIAARGFKSMPLRVETWTVKDELEVVLAGIADEAGVLSLIRNKGALVQLVFCDAEDFADKMVSKPQPDQPALLDDEASDEDVDAIDPETGEILDEPSEPAEATA